MSEERLVGAVAISLALALAGDAGGGAVAGDAGSSVLVRSGLVRVADELVRAGAACVRVLVCVCVCVCVCVRARARARVAENACRLGGGLGATGKSKRDEHALSR